MLLIWYFIFISTLTEPVRHERSSCVIAMCPIILICEKVMQLIASLTAKMKYASLMPV